MGKNSQEFLRYGKKTVKNPTKLTSRRLALRIMHFRQWITKYMLGVVGTCLKCQLPKVQ